ncbi:MAG: hypothetical protein ACE5FB_08285, partial [Candidatus Binatia bacterium]
KLPASGYHVTLQANYFGFDGPCYLGTPVIAKSLINYALPLTKASNFTRGVCLLRVWQKVSMNSNLFKGGKFL